MKQMASMMLWCALVLCTTSASGAAQIYVPDPANPAGAAIVLDDAPAAPSHARPVLFVHGHNALDENDTDFNFRKNWFDSLAGLPSFAQTLAASSNSALGIEPYFIRLENQARALVEDAAEIDEAVGRILARHDPAYDPADPDADTQVQVAIIAYSKGTLSTRLYLKSLVDTVAGMPAPRPTLRPVSEFIAIAPPNHGLRSLLSIFGDALSGDQLNNGYGPPIANPVTDTVVCTESGDAAARNFIAELNGHDMADSHADAVPLGSYPSEAPGSRAAGAAPGEGVLYVTLYANGNRDFVGGDDPPGSPDNVVDTEPDCDGIGILANDPKQGRVLARNLAPDAVNLPIASVSGTDAVDVHQRTVHAGEVICVALHTVVHHDLPAEGVCAVTENTLPEVVPTERAAVELVLDFSQSMQHPVCETCAEKIAILHDAAQLFVDLWGLVASPADHLGVTYFRSSVAEMQCGDAPDCTTDAAGAAPADETLVPLFANADRIRANLTAQGASGATAMGGALANALERLSEFEGPHSRILLFTDGMQNRDPMVEIVPPACADADCGYQIAGGPSLDADLGVAIDTIGVGAGDAYLSLLNGIALATGGVSRVTLDPDADLRQYFVEDVIDVLRGFSPQLVDYRRGVAGEAGASEAFQVNASARKAIFSVSGPHAGFRVVKDGVDMTALGTSLERAGYRLWSLDLPTSLEGVTVGGDGTWQVNIDARPDARYEAAAIVDETLLEFSVSAGTGVHLVGEPIELTAHVGVAGVPLSEPVDLTALVHVPGTSLGNILATRALPPDAAAVNLEPDATLAQRKLAYLLRDSAVRAELAPSVLSLPMTSTGDGKYTTATVPLTVPGPYRVEFDLSGEHEKLGSFHRTASLTTHVSFANADLETTELTLVPLHSADAGTRVAVRLRPRDVLGNFLGPDYAHRISASAAGKPARSVEDLGDGTYRIDLGVPMNPTTPVELYVLGQTLLAGTLGDINTAPLAPTRPWWQYMAALLLLLLVMFVVRKAAA